MNLPNTNADNVADLLGSAKAIERLKLDLCAGDEFYDACSPDCFEDESEDELEHFYSTNPAALRGWRPKQ